MNKTPHTAGPWHNRWGKVTDGQDKAICMLNLRKGAHNGNLIAAAPDLLDALHAIVDAFGGKDSLLMAQCKAAIAKAEGEAQ